MRLTILFIFISLLVSINMVYADDNDDEITVLDDANQSLTIPRPAKRIIALAPNLAEMVYAAGAGDKLIGVSSYTSYPKAATKLPVIATYNGIDVEKVLSLKPDLIIAWFGHSDLPNLKKLVHMGIPAYLANPQSFEDISKTIQNIGELAGTSDKANAAAKQFHKRYTTMKKKYSKVNRLSVFYQVWNKPLLTVNRTTLISKVINLCGGRNVFAQVRSIAPQIDVESVLAHKPQVILMGEKKADSWRASWQQWKTLPAVKTNNIYALNPDLIERYGPRILNGAENVCKLLATARERIKHSVVKTKNKHISNKQTNVEREKS